MHFCNKCGNMYYVKILKDQDGGNSSSEGLIYYCRKCGNEDSELYKNENNVCVSKTHIIGETQDFKNIINEYPKVVLHLDENIRITFHSLVKADLLILSKSSFSYSAALLNENIVDATIIKSWWHKPLKKWIIS